MAQYIDIIINQLNVKLKSIDLKAHCLSVVHEKLLTVTTRIYLTCFNLFSFTLNKYVINALILFQFYQLLQHRSPYLLMETVPKLK